MTTLKIQIDRDLCQGHAVCMGDAPTVFHVTDEGVMTVLLEEPPESTWEDVESAADYCPTGAITLVRSE